MTKIFWLLLNVALVSCFLLLGASKAVEVKGKAGAAVPVTSRSPPEGNTTFLGGTTWCVARAEVSAGDLQLALDWACGFGKADCREILAGGRCYEPFSLVDHASYAFNSYYQANGNSDVACYFGGTAMLTTRDPSYDKCIYAASASDSAVESEASIVYKSVESIWWKINVTLLLLYLGFG